MNFGDILKEIGKSFFLLSDELLPASAREKKKTVYAFI